MPNTPAQLSQEVAHAPAIRTFLPRLLGGGADGLRDRFAQQARELDGMRHEVLQLRQLWHGFGDNACDAVILLARDLTPLHASSTARDLLRGEGAIFDAVHAEHRDAVLAAAGAAAQGSAQDLTCHLRPDTWVEARFRPLGMDGRVLLLLRDITGMRRTEARLADANAQLARLAQHDGLTGLANRGRFLRAAGRIMGGTAPTAVFLVDLDRFKPVKSMHGHEIADAVLQETARRLRDVLGEETMLARMGGDEFAALVPAGGGDLTLAALARDMIRAIEEPIRIGVTTVDLDATIGMAVSGRDGQDGTALLRAADIAMAQAKQAGGSCYRFFERRMGDAIAETCALTRDLKAAIPNGEIVPFFQPLVRIATGAVEGFEVLARWLHPQRGLLPPAMFLPLVEQSGLSPALFASVLSQACAAARDWGPGIRLTVNISPHELRNEALPDEIAAILRRAGFPGTRLEIEITENVLVDDSRVATEVLDRIRAHGISVALDDFGTGFSSLYHLRVLPFDKVKIDKSFMKALDTDPDDNRYVSAIIGLCHALELEMTAEGVEDEPTMVRLRELGCTYGQGYLFGHPSPAAEAEAMLVRSAVTG